MVTTFARTVDNSCLIVGRRFTEVKVRKRIWSTLKYELWASQSFDLELLHGNFFLSWSPINERASLFFKLPSLRPLVLLIRVMSSWKWLCSKVGLRLTGHNRRNGHKPVPVPLCPHQILLSLIQDRIQAYAIRGRHTFAWNMARLSCGIWPSDSM